MQEPMIQPEVGRPLPPIRSIREENVLDEIQEQILKMKAFYASEMKQEQQSTFPNPTVLKILNDGDKDVKKLVEYFNQCALPYGRSLNG